MSFPGQKARDPWRTIRAVEKATFVQDVIGAATHLLHEEELTERERNALALLRTTVEAPTEDPPIDPQLGPAQPTVAVNTALMALPKDPVSRHETIEVLSLVLDHHGVPDEAGRAHIAALRKEFIRLARANFESISKAKHSDGELGLWGPFRTSSTF